MVQTRLMCKRNDNQIAANNNKGKKKYDFEINEEARSIWMEEDYLIRHPPSPNAKVLPFELDFAAQDEWRQMSHLPEKLHLLTRLWKR
ncbi:hypothetical protein OROHE_015448 [Orobanche hederae]